MRVVLVALAPLFLIAPVAAPVAGAEADGFRACFAARGERVVASENADRRMTPASVTKLVVTAAALHHLGPAHRVETVLRSTAPVRGGVLLGDLVVEAAADPTWSARFYPDDARAPLRALARGVRERGVRRIAGDVVVDLTRFPGRSHPPDRPLVELAYAYGAPAAALAVDDATVEIEIAPGARVGAAGSVRLLGDASYAPRLENRIVTVPAERKGRGTVDVVPVWDGDLLVVRGEYPVSEPSYRIRVAAPSPERAAAGSLAAELARAGVEVVGGVRLVRWPASPPAADGAILARHASPPIVELLEPILTESSNWHAEMLLRVLARAVAGDGRIETGLTVEREFLEKVVGVAEDAFHLEDASGLSPYNLLTPRAVVELLRYVHRQSWGAAYVAALARPGVGTLEGWPSLPPVAAKTGTIQHTVALAGYLEPAAPDPVVFACMINHRPGPRPPQRAEIAALLRAWRARR